MARLTLQDLEVNEVELPGDLVYTVKPATRVVISKSRDLEARLEKLLEQETGETEEADDITGAQLDELVAIYGELLDVRLEGAVPRQARPSTVVSKLWKGDKITIPQLERLLAGITETDRPT